MKDGQRLMSLKQAAVYASVSYGTIWNAIKRKDETRLKAFKIAGLKRIVIERTDLDEWIDCNKEEL